MTRGIESPEYKKAHRMLVERAEREMEYQRKRDTDIRLVFRHPIQLRKIR